MTLDSFEEQYRSFFDRAPAMIWHVREDGVIIRANPAALSTFQMQASEVEGHNICDIFIPGETEFCGNYRMVLETGEAAQGGVELVKASNGTEKWVMSSMAPYKTENGAVVAICIFAVDLTEQKTAECKLRKSSRSFEKANRILRLESNLSRAILEEDFVDVHETLEDVGTKLGLNSAFLYRMERNDAILSCYWETTGLRQFPERISLGESARGVLDWTIDGKPVWGKPAKLPAEVKPLITPEIEGIVGTAVLIPIAFPDDSLCVMGFGTVNGRYWSEEEVEALYGLGRLIALLVKASQRNREMLSMMTSKFSEISSILEAVKPVHEYAE